jgi:hypothetical protein
LAGIFLSCRGLSIQVLFPQLRTSHFALRPL